MFNFNMGGLPETGQYIVMIIGGVLALIGILIAVFVIFDKKKADIEKSRRMSKRKGKKFDEAKINEASIKKDVGKDNKEN